MFFWQVNGESGSFAFLAGHDDASAMQLNDLARQRKADACALKFTGVGLIDLIEFIENTVDVFSRYAFAGIHEMNIQGVRFVLDLKTNAFSIGGEFDGVIDQMLAGKGHPLDVDEHGRKRVGDIECAFDVFFLRVGFLALEGRMKHFAEAGRLALQNDGTEFDFRERDEVIDQVAEPLAFGHDDFHELLLGLQIGVLRVFHQRAESLYGMNGSSEFMGNGGKEIRFKVADFFPGAVAPADHFTEQVVGVSKAFAHHFGNLGQNQMRRIQVLVDQFIERFLGQKEQFTIIQCQGSGRAGFFFQ